MIQNAEVRVRELATFYMSVRPRYRAGFCNLWLSLAVRTFGLSINHQRSSHLPYPDIPARSGYRRGRGRRG